MSKISVDVSSARIPVLQVGYQGENEVTDVLFDISSWITEFGEGVAQLRVKRPGNSEEESYVLSLTITDGIAVWTVSDTDTFNKGNGKVQLSYLVGNIVKKAVIYPYKVGKSIVGADNPVDPFDSWIERSKAWAVGKTLDGVDVPETDETYQNNAKYYAEQADILGSAQVVLATEQGTLATEKATLATEKADAAAKSEANAAASEAAVNGVSTQLTTRMSAIETEQSVQSARMDTLKFVDSLDLARFPFLTFKDISDGRVSTQGMCVADGYLIITKFKSESDATRFYVIDIETREYVSYYEYVTGHSNCLAYGNGNIYIADSSNVYVIPFSNGVMGAMVTKQTSFSATAVAYNPSNNKLYFRVYLSEGRHAIYESDTSLSDSAVIFNIVAPISDLTPQGFGCDGEYLYELTSGADRVERVLVYSMKGELVKCFEIPRDTFMEVEDIDFYNGYMFLNFNGSHSSYPPYVMCVPYLMDTAPSNISTVWSAINTNYDETELLDLYLNNTAEIAFPDGTSAKPFNTLFHAKTFIKNMRVPVKLNVSGTYTTFNIRHITAAPLMLAFVDAQITNLQVFRCSNVILTGSATLKTLKVEQGNCYCISTSIVFVGDTSTDAISVNRGMLTGYVGSMTTYASAVRALQGIVNISISSKTAVSDVNNSVHSMVCVDGTMQP